MNLESALYGVVDDIEAELKADLVLINSPIDQRLANEVILRVRERPNKKENVALILTTYGGDPNAAFRIARCFQSNYDEFNLIIFGPCKSAGSLIAIAATKIYMSDLGELGPLDVQVFKPDDLLSRSSGLDYLAAMSALSRETMDTFFELFTNLVSIGGGVITTKTASDIATGVSTALVNPIAAQVDPMRLGEHSRAMKVAVKYGMLLNPNRQDCVMQLAYGYPSHGFSIDYEQAKELFQSVEKSTDTMYILERVLTSFNPGSVREPKPDRPLVSYLRRLPPPQPDLFSDDDVQAPKHKSAGKEGSPPSKGSPESAEPSNTMASEIGEPEAKPNAVSDKNETAK